MHFANHQLSAQYETSKSYENFCELLTRKTQIPLEFRAYHSGPPAQTQLIHSGKIFRDLSFVRIVFRLSQI